MSFRGEGWRGFGVDAGIRRGRPLSPLIFALVADLLLKRLEKNGKGNKAFAFAGVAAVVMESEIEREGHNVNVNYVTLLWCSLAAVALLAAGALMRYLRAAAPKKVERSSHMTVGGETFF